MDWDKAFSGDNKTEINNEGNNGFIYWIQDLKKNCSHGMQTDLLSGSWLLSNFLSYRFSARLNSSHT